jgi:hypothetical protein
MSEHTKGEWFANHRHVGTITEGNGVLHVATAVDTSEGGCIVSDEAIANARLIAAAPDLLKALENLVKSNNDFGVPSWDGIWDEAEEVIKKAKGVL